jgi:putative addiction module component (TIGR02574 family)
MSPALQPVLARLSPEEKLQLVGELWDQIAATGLDFPLTAEQQAQLRTERDAIHRAPREGSTWSEVRSRIQAGP